MIRMTEMVDGLRVAGLLLAGGGAVLVLLVAR